MGTRASQQPESEAPTPPSAQEPGGQSYEIPAEMMIRKLREARSSMMDQIDMLSCIIEQKDAQIAALLSEREK